MGFKKEFFIVFDATKRDVVSIVIVKVFKKLSFLNRKDKNIAVSHH